MAKRKIKDVNVNEENNNDVQITTPIEEKIISIEKNENLGENIEKEIISPKNIKNEDIINTKNKNNKTKQIIPVRFDYLWNGQYYDTI